jgi:hypothetical protein
VTWSDERFIDLFDGKTATEIKSGAGPVDRDQFDAYLTMVQGRQEAAFKGKSRNVQRLKYVFTDPAGARENLPWMIRRLELATELDEGAVIIEVFTETGKRKRLTSIDDMEKYLEASR